MATSEISNTKTAPQAFAYLTAVSNASLLLAPLVGGGLYDPVNQYPRLGLSSDLLSQRPAFLACTANGLFGLGAALCVAFFFEEVRQAVTFVYFETRLTRSLAKTLSRGRTDTDAVSGITYKALFKTRGVLPVLILVVSAWSFGFAGAGKLHRRQGRTHLPELQLAAA